MLSRNAEKRSPVKKAARRILGCLLVLLSAELVFSPPAAAKRLHGVPLPPDARRVEDSRFVVPRKFDRALRFYARIYGRKPGILFERMPGPPGVRAIHIQNIKRRRSWTDINLYEVDGRVYVYVIPSPEKARGKRRR